MSQRKPKSPWNTGVRKMIVCIHSAKGVTQGKPVNELTVKLKVNKKTASKTPKAVKSANPFWGHFHYFEICPPSLTLQLCDGQKEFGQYHVADIQHFADDQIHEVEGVLVPRKAKAKIPVTGTITVRFYITKMPDRRAAFQGIEKKMYFYDNYSEYFKTGDLILYSGRTPLDIVNQLSSGLPYSHVGIVVEMPNPITEQRTLYVAEVTQDLDGMLDNFFQSPRNGVCVFPLQERFHNYFGNAIWWLPLKEQLDLKSEMSLLRYVDTLHLQSNAANITPAPIQNEAQAEFLAQFGYTMKYPETLTELWGPIMMINTLEQGIVYTVPELRRGVSTVRLNPQHFAKKGLEWKSPFPEWASNEKKATITVADLTKLNGFATQYLISCSSALSHFVLDKSLKFQEISEGNIADKTFINVSPFFDAPLTLAKANQDALLERQKRVQNMINAEGEDLNKLGADGSKSDDIISESEGEEEALLALKKQALQFEDGEDSTDTDTSSATTSASATAETPRPMPTLGDSSAANTSPGNGANPFSSLPTGTNPFLQPQPAEPTFPWKEYVTQDGHARVYYHNASENKTQWEMPPGFLEYKSALSLYNLAKAQQAEAAKHALQITVTRAPTAQPAQNPFLTPSQEEAPPSYSEAIKKPEQFPQQIAAMNPFLINSTPPGQIN